MNAKENYLIAFGARLRKARESISLSQEELGKMVGTSKSMISSYESGINDPRQSMIPKLTKALGISINWLMTGEDEAIPMGSFGSRTQYIHRTISLMEHLNSEGQIIVCNTAEGLQASGKYNRPESGYYQVKGFTDGLYLAEPQKVYTIGKAAAGPGYGNQDLIESYRLIMTTEVPKHDFTLDVVGDSMFPSIIDGDVVFVRKEYDRLNNKIYVLDIDGDTVIKRVVFDQDKITLISDNPDWDDREITGDQLKRVRVEGLVVGWETPER